MVKAINAHGEAKAFARLVVRSLGDFRRKEEFVQMEEKLIAPSFKEKFEDRSVPEGVSTKFECIVVGKPSPKVTSPYTFKLFITCPLFKFTDSETLEINYQQLLSPS